MRLLIALLFLLTAFAGCLSADGGREEPSGADDAPAPAAKTVALDFGQSAGYDPRVLPAAADEPYHQSLPFEVPANATSLSAAVDWSCTSLCRLEVRMHDPAGAVADRATGASETVLKVDAPAAGTWAFEWITDEVASVGVEGTVTVTIAFD